jgi:hypothetical protein
MILNSPTISGSLTVTGNIIASGSITLSGSVASASYAASASNALAAQTASFVLTAQTASFVANAQSASNAVSAQTASFANAFTVAGNLTAQTLVVQTITSSVDFVTGSTRFGSLLSNTHVFSGSVTINPGGLFVSSSGNVGIGVTPSAWSLGKAIEFGNIGNTVWGVNATQFNVLQNAYYNVGYYYASSNPASYYQQASGVHTWYVAPSGTANAALTFTSSMTILNNGNVGIGTVSPSNKLMISNNGNAVVAFRINDTNANASFLSLNASNTDSAIIAGGTSAIPFDIYTSGSVRMSIAVSGLVTIQEGVRAQNYAVVRASSFRGGLYTYDAVAGSGTDYGITIFAEGGVNNGNIYFLPGGSVTKAMTITSGGKLLVGRTATIFTNSGHVIQSDVSPGGEPVLEVYNQNLSDSSPAIGCFKNSSTTSSSARFIQFYSNGGTQAMGGIVGNGATNVQFASISDIREKENIISISGSLNKLLALNPVEFDWLKTGEHIKAGFVAQQVEEVFPEYVVSNMSNEGEEERKGLTGGLSSGIIAHLVKAIQELQAQITELKNK